MIHKLFLNIKSKEESIENDNFYFFHKIFLGRKPTSIDRSELLQGIYLVTAVEAAFLFYSEADVNVPV